MTTNYIFAHVADGVPYARDYGDSLLGACSAYHNLIASDNFSGIAFIIVVDDDGTSEILWATCLTDEDYSGVWL